MLETYPRKIFSFECDIYGHLNNANYLHIFEEARSELLDAHNLNLFNLLKQNISIFVIDLSLKFHKSIEVGSVLRIHTKILNFGRVKAIWQQEIYLNSELHTTLTLTTVFVKNRKLCRIPKDILDKLEKLTGSS